MTGWGRSATLPSNVREGVGPMRCRPLRRDEQTRGSEKKEGDVWFIPRSAGTSLSEVWYFGERRQGQQEVQGVDSSAARMRSVRKTVHNTRTRGRSAHAVYRRRTHLRLHGACQENAHQETQAWRGDPDPERRERCNHQSRRSQQRRLKEEKDAVRHCRTAVLVQGDPRGLRPEVESSHR